MVLSGLAKGGLESGVWIDEYNYQKVVWKVVYGLMNTITKTNTKKHYQKYESVIFSVQYIIAKSI